MYSRGICFASQHNSALILGGNFLHWFLEETSQLQLFLLKLSPNKSLDYSDDITERVLREKCTREPLPLGREWCILLCFTVCPERCSFKHKLHFHKRWWILKSSHDQGYCPRVCMLPQTASFYKLSPLLPWDFTKLKACWHLFQDLRSLWVPLSKLSVSVQLLWILIFFLCSCTHCHTAPNFMFVFEDIVVRGLPNASRTIECVIWLIWLMV